MWADLTGHEARADGAAGCRGVARPRPRDRETAQGGCWPVARGTSARLGRSPAQAAAARPAGAKDLAGPVDVNRLLVNVARMLSTCENANVCLFHPATPGGATGPRPSSSAHITRASPNPPPIPIEVQSGAALVLRCCSGTRLQGHGCSRSWTRLQGLKCRNRACGLPGSARVFPKFPDAGAPSCVGPLRNLKRNGPCRSLPEKPVPGSGLGSPSPTRSPAARRRR